MDQIMSILTIQSRVTSGYVGNAAAVPILQRLGRTVWPIDTVNFSNHPAHGSHTGQIRSASEIDALVDGLQQQHLLSRCDAVLSGYLGSAAAGPAVRAAVQRARDANPTAIWCCDPVMGDHGQFYVAEDIPPFFRDQALPHADVVLPNTFEAAHLSGVPVSTATEAAHAARLLLAKGPKTVIVTGVEEDGRMGVVAAEAAGCWSCFAPAIEAPAYGAGDAFTALFVSHYLAENSVSQALGFAVNGIHGILAATAAAGTADLNLIAALPVLDDLSPAPATRIG